MPNIKLILPEYVQQYDRLLPVVLAESNEISNFHFASYKSAALIQVESSLLDEYVIRIQEIPSLDLRLATNRAMANI